MLQIIAWMLGTLLIISLILNIVFFNTARSLFYKEYLLRDQLSKVYDMNSILYKEIDIFSKKMNNRKFEFDAVTTRLILLAANNDNVNEARNAALKACKKIAMNLKG